MSKKSLSNPGKVRRLCRTTPKIDDSAATHRVLTAIFSKISHSDYFGQRR